MQKITHERFLEYKFISQLKSNESGRLAAFLESKPNLEKNKYDYELFYTDGLMKKRALKLKDTSSFIFETDDTILMPYTKTKQEEKDKKDFKSIYYRYTFSTEKLEKAYQFNAPFSIVKVLGDKLLLQGSFTAQTSKLYQLEDDARKDLIKDMKKSSLYEDITDLPFYFNGAGFTANERDHLFIYSTVDGSIKPLVSGNFTVDGFLVNRDKTTLYYFGFEFENARSLSSDLYAYDLINGVTTTLYNGRAFEISDLYELDDLLLIAATDMKTFGLNQNPSFYTLKDNDFELFYEMFDSIGNALGSDVRLGGNQSSFSKDALYFLTTTDDHITLNKLTKNRVLEPLYKMDGSIDGFTFVNDKLLLAGLYKQKLQELYVLDLNRFKLMPFTSFNRKAMANYYVAKPKTIELDKKTHTVKGFVLLPEDFDKSKTYPAILDIHGGPKTIYGKVYYHEMQVWANMGYVVFFCNPRGSDGKGDAFADIRGKYGTIDYEDIMDFTDLVLKRFPQIDQKQVFVTGGSYGGFMTNWIVSHTDRFKAAATQRSISNWISFYGTSDIGFYFAKDQTDGHPLLDTDKLWEQSPLKHAMHVKTPLLFIHSDEDYRCPIEQAMQFYSVLKTNQVDTKLVWFKGENHDLSRGGKPQARLKRLNEITNWFEKYQD